MILKKFINNFEELVSEIRYYNDKDCFTLGANKLYTFRRLFLTEIFYIMDESDGLCFSVTDNTLIITDLNYKLISQLPIPENKDEYFHLNIMHDYQGITYKNVVQIIDFFNYMVNEHGWKLNGNVSRTKI